MDATNTAITDPHLLLAAAEGCGPGLVAKLLDPHQEARALLQDPPSVAKAVAKRLLDQEYLQATAQGWQLVV